MLNSAHLSSDRELIQSTCSIVDACAIVKDAQKQTAVNDAVKKMRQLSKAMNLEVATRLPVVLILDRVRFSPTCA